MIVVELGRRVYFDFDKYGHTPTCLDRGDQALAGKTATVQVVIIAHKNMKKKISKHFESSQKLLESNI